MEVEDAMLEVDSRESQAHARVGKIMERDTRCAGSTDVYLPTSLSGVQITTAIEQRKRSFVWQRYYRTA